MALDLFNPEMQQQRTASSSDVVGKIRSGYQINNRPAALSEWRFTTGDPDVAAFVAATFGGEKPQQWETNGEDNIEVFTKAASLDIILVGENAIDPRMLIWAKGAKRIVTCDGSIVETEGKPHSCELGGFRNKREHAEGGHECEPRISITFRLAARPELGLFRFETGSWSMATDIAKAIGAFQKVGAPARATITLEAVEYEKNGVTNRFTKPVLTVTGPVE